MVKNLHSLTYNKHSLSLLTNYYYTGLLTCRPLRPVNLAIPANMQHVTKMSAKVPKERPSTVASLLFGTGAGVGGTRVGALVTGTTGISVITGGEAVVGDFV